MARLTQQYTEPVNDLEDADEDADYADKDDDDIEEADYEEIGEEVKYG